VGLATRLDVLRAELLMAQAEAQLEAQRELLAEQLDQLKILTGRPLEASIDLQWQPASGAKGPSAGVESLIPIATATRLDLVEARDRVRDSARTASVARWHLIPDVGVTASYAEQRLLPSPNLAGGVGALGADVFGGWQVGVVTTYSLDRTGRSAVAAADIATRASQRAVEELEQQVVAEVRRAHRAAGRAEATIAIQSRAVELARQQLRLAELRYERGLAGNFDVIDAETSVFQAESALIAAEGARELAALELELAVGTLSPASLPGGGV
jgi:outer membrane protein TolC